MGGIKDADGDSNSGIALFDFVESRTSGRSYVKRSRVGASESDEERLPPPRLDCPTRAAFSYRGLRKAIRHRGCFVPGRASNRRLCATGSASFFFLPLFAFASFQGGGTIAQNRRLACCQFAFFLLLLFFVAASVSHVERPSDRFLVSPPLACVSPSPFSSFAR